MTPTRRWQRELLHTWPVLRPTGSAEFATSVIQLGAERRVRLAVDNHATRHLLIPTGEEELQVDPVEGVLTVGTRTDSFSGSRIRHLDIGCRRVDLFDVFDELVCEVLSAIEGTTRSPTTTALEVIDKWRTLLTARGGRLLTLPRQVALFAELTVLDILAEVSELHSSWWRGPLREPHDIVGPSAAIEVKAVGAASSEVEIHGAHQLDPPGMPLALVLIETTEVADGRTVSDLARSFLNRASDAGLARRLLAQAGWCPADADAYTTRFAANQIVHIEVSAEIPRVVPELFVAGDLPTGVVSMNYSVAVDALNPHAVRGESALQEWWKAQV